MDSRPLLGRRQPPSSVQQAGGGLKAAGTPAIPNPLDVCEPFPPPPPINPLQNKQKLKYTLDVLLATRSLHAHLLTNSLHIAKLVVEQIACCLHDLRSMLYDRLKAAHAISNELLRKLLGYECFPRQLARDTRNQVLKLPSQTSLLELT